MLTFDKFSGINNVAPTERLQPNELAVATNVDIDLTGALRRRGGYSEAHESCHKNLWQADGFMLATVDNKLTAIFPGGTREVVHESLGVSPRVWYTNLPDGRTAYSNGLISGLTDGLVHTAFGVPRPASLGAFMTVAGGMDPGSYRYAITYVRLVDGREGPPAYSQSVDVSGGGFYVSGLPSLAGHSINVYLTGRDGEQGYYAGNTLGTIFSYIGANDALTMPCRTDFLDAPPVGTIMATWNGRVLVAVGKTLYASKPYQWELFDLRRDFKQFTDGITAVVPVTGGIFVGTASELAFLGGTEWDKLSYAQCVAGPTVLGSGVSVRGELLPQREGAALGEGAMFIADGIIVTGFSNGNVIRLTEGKYRTSATEVSATFRVVDGIPQYIAVPQ